MSDNNIMAIELEPEQEAMTRDRSDAMAWRELMRATDNDTNDSLMRAWENWRERESWAGRANRAVGHNNNEEL